MTVLLPWPSSSFPLRAQAQAARSHAWRTWRPPVAAQTSAPGLPSCEALPPGHVGALSLDLSALGKLRPALARQALGLRAGMAELVLLNRLRARTRRELCVDTLEQAARILEVTARSWWTEDASKSGAEPA